MPVGSVIPDLARQEAFINHAWGGAEGIMRGAGTEAACAQTTPPSLSVRVGAFKGFVGGRCVNMDFTTETTPVAPPTGGADGDLRRIDLVQYTLGPAALNIKTGAESPSPTAPDPDANSIPIAHLYLRRGMASIKTSDDATNGYIVDRRSYV